MDNEEQKLREAEKIFSDKAVLTPARPVVIPDGRQAKSLGEAEDELGQESDLKAVLKRLFPKFPESVLNQAVRAVESVMVGRVAPDTMLDRIYLTVYDIVDSYDPRDLSMDFWSIVNLVTTAFEIGLDSKGRVDAIEVHGATSKEEEGLERIASYMGGS